MASYEQAISQLRSPHTWCEGAKTLATLGDRRAVVPLVHAFETPMEGHSKQCLIEALSVLAPASTADDLFDRASGEERRVAVHLMELHKSDSHLERLERAVTSDADRSVRTQALRALRNQVQTPAWQHAMIRLLAVTDETVRGAVIEALGWHPNAESRSALQNHLGRETVPSLREAIERILAKR